MASTVIVNHPNRETLSASYKRCIKNTVHSSSVFGGAIIKLGSGPSTLMTQEHYDWFPNGDGMLSSMVSREIGALQKFDDNTLFLDIETDSADERWNQTLPEFFRLGQYAWGEGEVAVTTNLNEVLDAIDKAETVIAHNGHNFDFSVLLGNAALPLTMSGKLFDTWTHATLVCPAPFKYNARNGHAYVSASTPGNARRWFSLDNMAFQFGLDGKIEDEGLKALAKEFGGFGAIPTDDERYVAYARVDVEVLREVARSIIEIPYNPEYAIRAQKCAAIDAQFTRNGCLVDMEATVARSKQQAKLAQDTLEWLVQEYGFPTEGKQPWKSNPGKAAIDRLMDSGGARVGEWPKTAGGARSYSGDALKAITEGTELEETGERLAQIMGQRTLADQIISYTYGDGRVHPNIDKLQVSGRTSVTCPGVTTFGTRAETIEKSFMVPDPGFVMMEFDLSNADARCVAILSGDTEYAKRFLPGVDGHEVSGRLMYGDKEYEKHMPDGWEDNPHVAKENPLRHVAKALGHAYSYGAGAKKLAATANQPIELAQKFVSAMKRAYPQVIEWQNAIRREGETGWVTGISGRRMPCVVDRAYTQAPALAGQNGTSEFLSTTLLRLYDVAPEVLQWVKWPIHDALLVQLPQGAVRHYAQIIKNCAFQTINNVDIFMESGEPGDSWMTAQH